MSKHIVPRDNFIYLTIAIILLLLFSAILDQYFGDIGERILLAIFVLTLASGVWSIKGKRSFFRSGIGLVLGIILVTLVGYWLDESGLSVLHLLIMLVFFVLTCWVAVQQVIFSGRIDGNSIVGAICIYLLLGMIWAMLYLLIENIAPGSFKGLPETGTSANVDSLIYFSFISLTTMGFGDITPALPLARFLTYMEGLVGQFYLAILVASLVGTRVSVWQQKGDDS